MKAPDRRGIVIPLAVLLLPVVLIMAGFAVDLSLMQKTRSELRVSTDAAARAAALELSRSGSQAQAIAEAQRVALANPVASQGLTLEPSDIRFGSSQATRDGRYVFSEGGSLVNAVRVNGRRVAGTTDGPVSLMFGGLIGTNTFEPTATAVASYELIDICLVLDRSTSMKTNVVSSIDSIATDDPEICLPPSPTSRFLALVEAIEVFTDQISRQGNGSRIGIVTYASDISASSGFLCNGDGTDYYTTAATTVDLNFTDDLNRVNTVINQLAQSMWNGRTEIENGLRTGLTHILGSGRLGTRKLIVLLTDGNQTDGDVTVAARECAESGIVVHTITFGAGASQEPMRNTANITGGVHYHAPDTATLRDAFQQIASFNVRLTE